MKSSILLECLTTFYDVPENFTKMTDIIEKNQISLRIIEWYVTIYAKQNKRQLHCEYKNKLKGLHKSNFDPYCRKFKTITNVNGVTERQNVAFMFECKSGKCYTTIAQLNFYKWLIENKIIDYIYNEYNELYTEFKEYERLRV